MRPARSPAVVMIIFSVFAGSALAQSTVRMNPVTANIGVEGRFLYRVDGSALRVRTVSPKSPMAVRVAAFTYDGTEAGLYDLRFIGSVAGDYDLRDWMERIDGGPVQDLPPASVRIVSILADDHTGELTRTENAGLPWLRGYRAVLIGAGVLWLAPIGIVLAKRISRRRKLTTAVPEATPLTLADQLRPMIEAAMAGSATDEDLARLERLLMAYWKDRLGLQQRAPRAALAALRSDPEGGKILRAVEHWLHSQDTSDVALDEVGRLLAPYRRVEALA